MRVDRYIVDLPEPKSKTKVATLRGLYKDQSIFIPDAELTKSTRKGIYGLATLAKIKITTRKVEGGLRVWRTDGESMDERTERERVGRRPSIEELDSIDISTGEVPMSHKEKLDGLRDLMGIASSGVKASEIYGDEKPGEPVDEWAGWSGERETLDQVAGETVYYREHLKTRKRKEIRRETYYG